MIILNERSKKNLIGVHADLVYIVRLAAYLSELDFIVIEGLRTKERQRQLVESGASKTMNSRHLTGHAVDCVPVINGQIPWDDWGAFKRLAEVMKQSALILGVNIAWGGDWKTFKDGPHFELA